MKQDREAGTQTERERERERERETRKSITAKAPANKYNNSCDVNSWRSKSKAAYVKII